MEVNAEEVREHAFLISLGVFVTTFSGVLLLTLLYDFSDTNLGGLLFLISFICCVLIAKNIYDVASLQLEEEPIIYAPVQDTSQSMYMQLYQKSPIPYFVIDTNGIVTSANTAAARLLGLQQKRMVGINIFSMLETGNEEHKDTLIKKFISGLGVSDELVQLKRSDHREVWGLLSLFQFINTNQQTQTTRA